MILQLINSIVQGYNSPETLKTKIYVAYSFLKEKDHNAISAFVDNGGIEALTTVIEAYTEFPEAVDNAASLISCVAGKNEVGADRFAACGGIKILASRLSFYAFVNPNMCYKLCYLVSSILTKEEYKKDFMHAGGVNALLDILSIAKTKEHITAPIVAFLRYTFENDTGVKAISEYPNIGNLLCRVFKFLMTTEVNSLNAIIVLLHRCTNPNNNNSTKSLCENGIISLLIEAIRTHYGDFRIRKSCLAVLDNLSYDDLGPEMITLAGGVEVIVRVLHECKLMDDEDENKMEIVCAALSVLYNVTVDCKVGMMYSFENGVIEDVISLLEQYSNDRFVCFCSFGIVSTVLMNNEYSKILELDKSLNCEAAIVIAIRSINVFKDEIRIQNRAINLIANAAICENFLEVIIRESGHLALVEALKRNKDNKFMTLNCIRAIGNMTGDSENFTRTILETGVISIIRDILHDHTLNDELGVKTEYVERCIRALELFLSYDNLYTEYATPELLDDIITIAEPYSNVQSIKKSCDSIKRKTPPEVLQAIEKGLCTNVCVPKCKEMCPFNDGHYYCPKCCIPQLTYFCKTCSERHEKFNKFCVTCWKHHPQSHVFERVYLSRRCHCDCYTK